MRAEIARQWRYYSTRVVVVFSLLPVMWGSLPDSIKAPLYALCPWLPYLELPLWLAAFVASYYRAKAAPQPDIPRPTP